MLLSRTGRSYNFSLRFEMTILHKCHRASTTSAVLSSLDNQLESLASRGAVIAANKEEHEKAWQSTLKDITEKQKDGRSGRRVLGGFNNVYGGVVNEKGSTREEPMDVDDAVVENKGKNRK